MTIDDTLTALMARPSPEALWDLREAMLAAGVPIDSQPMAVLDEFHGFLVELIASSTARQFSHFASLLDLGAVGGVAVQNLLEGGLEGDWWSRLLAGGASESLMVMAARQYVKSWEEELKSTYLGAAWYLAGSFWRLSQNLQPDLPAELRNDLVGRLVDPIRDDGTAGTVKAAVIVHYFQLLLVAYVKGSPLLVEREKKL